MKNSILKFDDLTSDTYLHKDYTSFDYSKVYQYVLTCTEDFFDWYQVKNNDKMERISFELYKTTDYWDILVLINSLSPMFDIPYDFDVLYDTADEFVTRYKSDNPDTNIPETHALYMHNEFERRFNEHNEEVRTIRIVKPSKIQEFFRKGRELGCFK